MDLLQVFVQQLTGDVKVYEVPAAMTFGEFKHQLQGSQVSGFKRTLPTWIPVASTMVLVL